jgi:hypothetical protein
MCNAAASGNGAFQTAAAFNNVSLSFHTPLCDALFCSPPPPQRQPLPSFTHSPPPPTQPPLQVLPPRHLTAARVAPFTPSCFVAAFLSPVRSFLRYHQSRHASSRARLSSSHSFTPPPLPPPLPPPPPTASSSLKAWLNAALSCSTPHDAHAVIAAGSILQQHTITEITTGITSTSCHSMLDLTGL